ncbi:unnamed protein product [Schistosoma curassoni]|uniref:Uncharacterized protein n=1 Tax=Schistosoma curassoni TaxID=6186 RepID=A0A3P8G5C4_9TREM|nr:unnamed protein product [Schistosoma curassoni]
MLSSNQKVQLYVNPTLSENNPGVIDQQHSTDTNTYRIVGLDNYGYLLVEDICTGIRHKLHPDGNSMDMMRGLIITK